MASLFQLRALSICFVIATWFCPLRSLALPAGPADPLIALPNPSLSVPNVTSTTNTELHCVAHRDWVGHGILAGDCQLAINTFYSHIHRTLYEDYEFVDFDVTPETHVFIKTPLKFTIGTLIWPCSTMSKL